MTVWIAGCLLSFAITADPSSTLSAKDIADKAKNQTSAFGSADATAEVSLKVVPKGGDTRLRSLSMKSKRADGLNKSLVRFTAPPDVAGSAFLSLENKDRDNDQFLFLPALSKTKRISGAQRSQSFMGTDFSYADFDARYLSAASMQRLDDDDKSAGVPCFVLFADKQEGEYSKFKVWVDRASFVTRRVEFSDRAGELWKILTVKKVQVMDGRNVVTESVMEDVKKGSRTETLINKIDFKAKVDDSEFTEKALSRG